MPKILIFNLNKAPASKLLKSLIEQNLKESRDVILLDTFAHPSIFINHKEYERKKLDEDFSKQTCRELGQDVHAWLETVAGNESLQGNNPHEFRSVCRSLANDSLSRMNDYHAFSLYMLEKILKREDPDKIILIAGVPKHRLYQVVKEYLIYTKRRFEVRKRFYFSDTLKSLYDAMVGKL